MKSNRNVAALVSGAAGRFKPTAVCTGLVIAFGGLAMTPGAVFAQESAQLQRVEVTGSNIPRADKETPSPVQVIGAEELKASGYTTVNEVLQNLTANGNGTLGKGFSGAFAGGATGVSLRGLTVGATLVLIDGHRMAPYPAADDGQRSFVDVGSIPFQAIERIEVLKDGASAVYGSDAMAGVINIILKKAYSGTSVSADIGTTQQGGGTTSNFSIARGFGDASSGTNGYIALEARKSGAIKVSERSGDWARLDFRPEGGIDARNGARNVVINTPRVSNPYLQATTGPSANAANFVFFPGSGCTHAQMRASECTFRDTWSQIQPDSSSLNLIGRLNMQLGGDWDMRLTGSRFESKTLTVASPQAIPFGTFAGVTAVGLDRVGAVLGANPAYTVPATYPGNTLGKPAGVRGYLAEGLGGRTTDITATATRFAADLSGAAAGWDLNLGAGYTRVEQVQVYGGYIHYANLFSALNSAANPYLLTGGNSQAMQDFVAPKVTQTGTSELTYIDARGSRELMKLAGGPFSVGAGYSYTNRKLNSPNAAERSSGAMNTGSAFAAGKETVNSVYAELVAPVLKNLELDAALRHDRYESGISSTTPKVAFKFAPIKEVTLRGTAAWGFRAPNSQEVGNAGLTFGFDQYRDPILCAVSDTDGSADTSAAANVPATCAFAPTYLQNTTNKALESEKSKSMTFGLILEPFQGWATTLDYYKVTIDDQIISASSTPTFQRVPNTFRGIPQSVTFGDGSTGLSPVGLIQYINTGYINANSTSTSGVEFETKYKFKLPAASSLTVGLQLSHMLDYKVTAAGTSYELAGTHGPGNVGGNTGSPKDRAAFTLNYENGPWTVATTTNYVGSYNVTDPSGGYLDCQAAIQGFGALFANGNDAPSNYCTVGSFTTTNVSVKYQYSKGLTLRGAVVNLFGAEPSVDLVTYGGTGATQTGASLPYNSAFHQAGAVGRIVSIGLDYKF